MHFANSGDAALGLLSDGIEPQLIVILSDINMPGMDGLQLLGEIKQHFPDMSSELGRQPRNHRDARAGGGITGGAKTARKGEVIGPALFAFFPHACLAVFGGHAAFSLPSSLRESADDMASLLPWG
jgi:DNA-binding LytR/AlgR family response regulator